MTTPVLMTVTGPVPASPPVTILPHEHVMSIFGHDARRRTEYDEPRLFGAVLPYLDRLRSLGCSGIADCTSAYIGRRPDLLREMSRRSGMLILTNTGYYGAAGGRYLPPDIASLSVDDCVMRWKAEWEGGVDGTGVRPGFVKTGVDHGPLREIDRMLLTAAARVSRTTGLAVQTHLGNNPAGAAGILGILQDEGADPGRWIWVHAHLMAEHAPLVDAARQGAWISLDGLGAQMHDRILAYLEVFRDEGLLEQILVSHDGNSYTADGSRRPYDCLFTEFLDVLRGRGFTDAEVNGLIARNPCRALAVSPA